MTNLKEIVNYQTEKFYRHVDTYIDRIPNIGDVQIFSWYIGFHPNGLPMEDYFKIERISSGNIRIYFRDTLFSKDLPINRKSHCFSKLYNKLNEG